MSHGAGVQLEQSSLKDQAFHLTLSSPSCQTRDSEFPEAALHHPLTNQHTFINSQAQV